MDGRLPDALPSVLPSLLPDEVGHPMPRSIPPRRAATFLALAAAALLAVAADAPPAPIPVKLAIEPAESALAGRRATRQLIATATLADGSPADLTRAAGWASLNPEIAEVSPRGRVVPRGDGTAVIVAKLGGIESKAVVRVEGMGKPAPVSFRNDVIPSFSQAGCNMGACHGTPTGKGGFKLSLRGYMPDVDFVTLTRDSGARRIDTFAPDSSILIRKPLGEIPHEGGLRLRRGTKTFEYLRDWMAEGSRDDPAAPAAVKLELLPGPRVLNAPAKAQQIAAIVHYADGSARDVTPTCYYSPSNPDVAEVDADGYVTFKRSGEVAVIAHYLDLVANVRLTHLVDVPGFSPSAVPQDNPIDRAVFAKLNRMRIKPSDVCTDPEFLRRAYLDTIGVMPTPEEARAFLADASADRRAKVIDALLARPEFLDFWTLKFADILRANGRLIQSKGAQGFYRWIHASLEKNVPLDRFVRDLLTADGSTFQNPAANYYRISREPETAVETTAQLFLGVRIACAKCHNHPFERWTQDDYYGFASIFAQVKRKKGALPGEEIIYHAAGPDVRQPRTGQAMKPKALGGPVLVDGAPTDDRRTKLAAWLTGADNPFFARSLANRIWYHLMGRGVVEPVDDFRDSNPPSNDELLDALAAELTKGGYNLRTLIRTILVSRTYQLAARSNPLNADDSLYFSHAVTKLLPAEVLLDAISAVTGTATTFDGQPRGLHAIQLADGATENPFLKTFGRPARELACECEREGDANLSQALQLIGGATVNGKLRDDAGRIARLAKSPAAPDQITRDLYLAALSREPEPAELAAAVAHLNAGKDRRQAVEDLGWVLINSKEFLFRH